MKPQSPQVEHGLLKLSMFGSGVAVVGLMTNGLHHRDGDIDACGGARTPRLIKAMATRKRSIHGIDKRYMIPVFPDSDCIVEVANTKDTVHCTTFQLERHAALQE